MWLMLQQDTPDDFVVATGEVHSVRELVELAFKYIGVIIAYVPLIRTLLSKNSQSLCAFSLDRK